MYDDRQPDPFDTIESAQEFIALLQCSIGDTRRDIERDIKEAASVHSIRREQALQLTLFKMDQLAASVQRSQRLLNDLRTLRRLLFNERTSGAIAAGMSL